MFDMETACPCFPFTSIFRSNGHSKENGLIDHEQDTDMTDEQAAVRIQATYKGFKVRKEMAVVQDQKEEAAAVKIQAVYRGHQTRKDMEDANGVDSNVVDDADDFEGLTDEEAAAIRIQAQFRGHQTRKTLAAQGK